MKSKIVLLLTVLLIFPLTSCATLGNSLVKTTTGYVGGDYRVTFYSGGKAVREWQVKDAIINEEEGSDGWYFSCKRELVRISGDVVVEPLKDSEQQVEKPIICN